MRRLTWSVVLLCILATAPSAMAQTDQRCFAETNQCIGGRIRQFWEQNGGLPVFGFPTSPQQEIQIEGRPFQAQVFERNRLELHPENQPPYDVLLGRLGADRLAQLGRDPFTFAKSGEQPGCRFFPETQHNVCGDILAAWHANGLEIDDVAGKSEGENLALFGLPLSDVQAEQLEGKQYQVQWFERGRFEVHPENQPPFNVLLGLLGNEIRTHSAPLQAIVAPQPAPSQGQGTAPAPAPEPAGAPTGSCDPSYPDVCIPPAPPDLDCGQLPYDNIRVLPPDPHRLDRDKDGVGCES